MDFRFVHAADLHLDTPFSGMARLSPEIAAILREASLEAFDDLIRLTIRVDAAFLLLAGDIYDGEERGLRGQLRLLRGFQQLSRKGIKVFVVHGNHDPAGGWSAVGEWPPGVTIFEPGEVRQVPVEKNGRRLAVVQGISYGRRHETENLALRFRPVEGSGLQVGLLHCHAGSDPAHGPYSPCSVDDLLAAGLDYWALGHLHRRRMLAEGGPWIAYPGNLQGRSLSPAETGVKGALVAEATDGAVRSVRFVALDRVRFVSEDLSVDGFEDLTSLNQSLHRRAEALRAEHEGRHLVLRITLTGGGQLHTRLGTPGLLDDLLEELRHGERRDGPLLWWASIRDATRTPRNLDSLVRRDDFSAAVIRLQRRLAGDPEALQRFVRRQVGAPPLLHGLARRTTPPDETEMDDLLRRALDRALDLLEADQ
jgi:exonuclease SbcD